ncbi:hypothetical protein DO021_04465 [Desulfobacter hydrogenophilus]|uniref:Uncharacterized protein n=1 Tax=Desulfobacter hydrogenophilus TaxID=2291 RepID=A0A328FH20_9BACT|nr:acetate--CoA ligase family protein [Desulfobacter hydrogenophilus]NDY70800.1 hypothetical protein [Desulfobacter hydrogenophilus]QBH11572.1 hypothetical protein EYB58_00730 [Desulfobacter hydrogenophilus]RAM03120.1 hypothetical protein DO021_04465 [Desulfobacter hydrogenophilus]
MHLAPFRENIAAQIIREIKGFALIKEVRGQGPADIETLIHTLTRRSAFAAPNAHRLESLDLNPFLMCPRREYAVAVDAFIVPRQM